MTSTKHHGQRRRAQRRSAERGAAVFVVVLVITLLSALGLFAVRSAVAANASAGNTRQMTQVHYVTEYAVHLAAGELGGDARQNYADEMRAGTHTGECTALSSVSNPTCFAIHLQNFDKRVQAYDAANQTFLADGLGQANNEAVVRVELTELRPKADVRGMALTGLQAEGMPRYFYVTVTASGQVRPQLSNPSDCNEVAAAHGSAGIETSRAHVVVGPLTP